ncbi:conserved hypothetical protein [Histoplasma capsulatum H143]|uniref:BZIP domain-containing protein n=1 Tax=Ajellomyces capsulatus (strain H143) TaxID=544712 RepID=C6HE08_AJECH|nr:conserved hypothetical protein [Histoplasma capsulatum H143]
MAPKRQRRKPSDPAVPDISDDAAERKRVLNVLAQRRYRHGLIQRLGKRKREYLATLEAKLHENGQGRTPTAVDPLSTESTPENPSGYDILPLSEATEAHTTDEPPASPGTIYRVQEALLDSLEAIDSSSSGSSFFGQSELPGFAPELMMNNSSSPSLSSSSSVVAMSSHSCFETLLSLAPSSPEPEAFPYQFLQTPFSIQDFAPSDLSATLQSHQTTTFTFPDDHTIEIPTLSLLRGMLAVAERLRLKDVILEVDAPTATQRLIPHHPIFDLFPWPTTRDKLIQVFSMPAHLRPSSASHPMAMMNLVYDIEDPSEGMRTKSRAARVGSGIVLLIDIEMSSFGGSVYYRILDESLEMLSGESWPPVAYPSTNSFEDQSTVLVR